MARGNMLMYVNMDVSVRDVVKSVTKKNLPYLVEKTGDL